MGLFEHFPYTNFHELNLDWLLRKTKELNDEVENTSDRMDGIEKSIVTTVQNTLTQWMNDGTLNNIVGGKNSTRNILLIGDSYLGRMQNYAQCKQKFETIFNNCYVAQFGGYGFATPADRNYSTVINTITPDNFSLGECSDIVFVGGYNDRIYDVSTILSGINTSIALAKTRFPNANIYIAEAGWPTDPGQRAGCRNAISAYQSAVEYGCGFIPLYKSMHRYSNFDTADGFHPNPTGAEKLVWDLIGYLISREYTPYTGGISFPVTWTYTNFKPTILAYYNNDYVQLRSLGGLFNGVSGITWTGSPTDAHVIGTYEKTSYFLGGPSTEYMNYTLPMWVRDSTSGGYTLMAGIWTFTDTEVMLQLSNMQSDGGNYKPVTPSAIVMPAMEFTYPLQYC